MSDKIKVSVVNKNIRVKITQKPTMAIINAKLGDITDVDTNGAKDKYLMVYNASLNKYEFINPDDILVAAVTEPNQVGLPTTFIDELDANLDNKIDLDAGIF